MCCYLNKSVLIWHIKLMAVVTMVSCCWHATNNVIILSDGNSAAASQCWWAWLALWAFNVALSLPSLCRALSVVWQVDGSDARTRQKHGIFIVSHPNAMLPREKRLYCWCCLLLPRKADHPKHYRPRKASLREYQKHVRFPSKLMRENRIVPLYPFQRPTSLQTPPMSHHRRKFANGLN